LQTGKAGWDDALASMLGTDRCERLFIYLVCGAKRTPTYCGRRTRVNKKTRAKSHRGASGPNRPTRPCRNYRSEANRRKKLTVRGVPRSSAGPAGAIRSFEGEASEGTKSPSALNTAAGS